MYSLLCTVCSVQCTVYSVQFTVHSLQCTSNIECTVLSTHYTVMFSAMCEYALTGIGNVLLSLNSVYSTQAYNSQCTVFNLDLQRLNLYFVCLQLPSMRDMQKLFTFIFVLSRSEK